MRRFAFLLLGLAACAELKTAAEEAPTPTVDATSPTSEKAPRADDDDTIVQTRPRNSRPDASTSDEGSAEPTPDAGVDSSVDDARHGNTQELCKARCDSELACKDLHTSLEYDGCLFGCTTGRGSAAAHYNKTYLAALVACFVTRDCSTSATLCEKSTKASATDIQTKEAIQSCNDVANDCNSPALLGECSKLGQLDRATQVSSEVCTLKDCAEVAPCLQTTRGEGTKQDPGY